MANPKKVSDRDFVVLVFFRPVPLACGLIVSNPSQDEAGRHRHRAAVYRGWGLGGDRDSKVE